MCLFSGCPLARGAWSGAVFFDSWFVGDCPILHSKKELCLPCWCYQCMWMAAM